jgi:hypothetical protein
LSIYLGHFRAFSQAVIGEAANLIPDITGESYIITGKSFPALFDKISQPFYNFLKGTKNVLKRTVMLLPRWKAALSALLRLQGLVIPSLTNR